jgi:hypothetical protein
VTAELKERLVDAWQELLRLYEAEGESFLKSIVIENEGSLH